MRTPPYFGRIWPIRSQCCSHFVRNWGSPPRPQEGPSGVAPRIGSVDREGRQVWAATRATSARAGQEVISRPLTAPARNAKPRGAAARRAEPRSPGRRRAAWVLRALRAARWARRPPLREGRPACRTAYLGAVIGSCEDHLAAATRRPRPRASPVQHLLLRLGVRRVLLQALGGGCGGVLAARGPLLGRAECVCTRQSTRRPPHRLAPLRSDAGRVAPRRAARDGARCASDEAVLVVAGAVRRSLCTGRGWRSGAVRNAARRVPRVAVCGLLDLPARGRAGLDKGPTVRARWRPRSEAAAVEVAQQTRPGSRHRHTEET